MSQRITAEAWRLKQELDEIAKLPEPERTKRFADWRKRMLATFSKRGAKERDK